MTIKVKEFRAESAGKAATPRVGLLRLERLAGILETAHRYYKAKKAIIGGTDYTESTYDELTGVFTPVPVEGYDQDRIGHECGTPACAIGHYAFNTPQRWGWKKNGEVLCALDFNADNTYGDDWTAQAAHEFCLNNDEGVGEIDKLFEYNGCGGAKTALEAARYIRKFVAKKRKALGLKKPAKK